jgi:putative tryptophan/tyrosine transport system substrate-binding protein
LQNLIFGTHRLRNHGWIDGKNITIEYRYAPSQDRLPAFAAELVAQSPDVLIGPNTPAAVALKSATASIPIVFVGTPYPEKLGLIQSMSHPGGNLTGLAMTLPGLVLAGLGHSPFQNIGF